MGSSSKKTHESFAVSPSESSPTELGAPSEVIANLVATSDIVATIDFLGAAGDYESFVDATKTATDELNGVVDKDLPPQLVADLNQQLKQATGSWLKALSPQELQELAEANGFQHAQLVGLNGNGPHPLVHWLDPAYDDELPSKTKIQMKAQERYNELVAGGTVNGKTLNDFGLTIPVSPDGPFPTWEATPIDVAEAHLQFTEALAAHQSAAWSEKGDAWLTLLDAENRLATATCPEVPELLAKIQAVAKIHADGKGLGGVSYETLGKAVDTAVSNGFVQKGVAEVLSYHETIPLLRASTDPVERHALLKLADERLDALQKLASVGSPALEFHNAMVHGTALPLDDPTGKSALLKFVSHTQAAAEAYDGVKSWKHAPFSKPKLNEQHPITTTSVFSQPPEMWATQDFRQWAKTQKLAELKMAASELGMPDTSTATRADVQNWIAGQWDPTAKAKVQQKLEGQTKTSSVPSAGKGISTPQEPVVTGGGDNSFSAKHLALVSALKHHAASTGDLPKRLQQQHVDEWDFKTGPSKSLGGAHSKSLHTAPDGSTWLFKPDQSASGARAEAEAAASRIYQRVGVPAVPVYTKRMNGKTGSIQPLLSGVSNISDSPTSWSQADVDAMVRLHVAAWAVGDHDGKSDNVLRTSAGGLIPCDYGQAFKFYGQDSLSLSYHPNKSYGAAPAVFHQAYLAGKQGTLAKGVRVRPEAALPVIKAFEAMPDAEYRSTLDSTAREGVKRNVHWVKPMRERAAKRLGKKTASDADVAEEFLAHALERKAGLRHAFSSFFADIDPAGAHKLSKVQ